MDVADVDADGSIDVAVAEHTDQNSECARDNLTVVYLNSNAGRMWLPQVIERGPHSSHLGTRLSDLDNDGVMEIVSTGWNQFKYVHLWKKIIPSYTLRKGAGSFPSNQDSGPRRERN